MLKHQFETETPPKRIVILGAQGFIGNCLNQKLLETKIPVLALGRQECDLLADNAVEILKSYLEVGDCLVFIAAIAPAKDVDMLAQNMQIIANVVCAAQHANLSHFINVSSDAVYSDIKVPMTEDSVAQPDSIHGVMHLAREVAIQSSITCPIAILRPTLVYGAQDPHNGYGPNKFRREVAKGQDISLFGNGEELRDHIYVEDVAELLRLIIMHKSTGVLNAATGVVTSFYQIAEMTVKAMKGDVTILTTERKGPMPHNGYRAFDPSETARAFPNFSYTSLKDGIDISINTK